MGLRQGASVVVSPFAAGILVILPAGVKQGLPCKLWAGRNAREGGFQGRGVRGVDMRGGLVRSPEEAARPTSPGGHRPTSLRPGSALQDQVLGLGGLQVLKRPSVYCSEQACNHPELLHSPLHKLNPGNILLPNPTADEYSDHARYDDLGGVGKA